VSTELYTSEKVRVKDELQLWNKKGMPFAAIVMNECEIIVKDRTLSAEAAHAAQGANQLEFVDVVATVEHITAALAKKKPEEVGERKFADEETK
jgi:hypothetical protein